MESMKNPTATTADPQYEVTFNLPKPEAKVILIALLESMLPLNKQAFEALVPLLHAVLNGTAGDISLNLKALHTVQSLCFGEILRAPDLVMLGSMLEKLRTISTSSDLTSTTTPTNPPFPVAPEVLD